MSGPRIAFIGAGSVEFTADADRRPPRLSGAARGDDLAARHRRGAARDRRGRSRRATASEAGPTPAIEAHLERRAALDGADYAINMIQVGGHAATVIDLEIPTRHGLRQTIGDTLGIGGIFRALRTIPVMQGIAADMAEVCPDAWLLNYTNPMAMLCWATYAGTPQQRIVGLCHSVQNTTARAGRAASASRSTRSPSSAPASTTRRGSCASSATARTSTRCSTRRSSATPSCCGGCGSRCTGGFGYFPTESSEHSAEYLPWFMRDDEAIERIRIWVGRVRRAQRGEPGRVRAHPRAARGRASRCRLEPSDRVRAADHPLDRDRRAAGDLRQRAQHGPDREPAAPAPASRCPCLVDASRRPADCTSASCRRSWRRSTGPSSTSAS